jgi:hypothetical protein
MPAGDHKNPPSAGISPPPDDVTAIFERLKEEIRGGGSP